jgi:5-methylcytosine-specific restriction endonuclease McrA
MGRKTPPFEKYEKWTTARFWTFIRSALRTAWNKWPPKYSVLNNSKRHAQYEWYSDSGKKLNVKWEYQCNHCKEWYMGKQVSVDHIVPVGTLKDYDDLPDFTRRLFVSEEDLQILCKECHDTKTQEERKR